MQKGKKNKPSNQPMHTLGIAAGNLWPISLIHINLTMCSKQKHTEVPIFGVLLVAHKGLFLPSTQVLGRSTKAQLSFEVLLQRKRSRDNHHIYIEVTRAELYFQLKVSAKDKFIPTERFNYIPMFSLFRTPFFSHVGWGYHQQPNLTLHLKEKEEE